MSYRPMPSFAICLPVVLGSVGICGGYGRFSPGRRCLATCTNSTNPSPLLKGKPVCLVQGNRYMVGGYDTAFVRRDGPIDFLNRSNAPMAMVWVYAGSEPGRTLVSPDIVTERLPGHSRRPMPGKNAQ